MQILPANCKLLIVFANEVMFNQIIKSSINLIIMLSFGKTIFFYHKKRIF
jgi:hypothetical protein